METNTGSTLARDKELRTLQQAALDRSKERDAEACAMKKAGLKYREIAAHFGVSNQRAQALCKRHMKRMKKAGG